jgi:hypothetical protein
LGKENARLQEVKRIMEEAQSNGSKELPDWLVENRDFRKFLKEAEKVRGYIIMTITITITEETDFDLYHHAHK